MTFKKKTEKTEETEHAADDVSEAAERLDIPYETHEQRVELLGALVAKNAKEMAELKKRIDDLETKVKHHAYVLRTGN